MQEQDKNTSNNKAPTLWDTVKSVAAAFFGVQSNANRVRDFTHGKASHFIIIGVVMTAVFVITLVMIVKLILYLAGV